MKTLMHIGIFQFEVKIRCAVYWMSAFVQQYSATFSSSVYVKVIFFYSKL